MYFTSNSSRTFPFSEKGITEEKERETETETEKKREREREN